MCRLSKVVRSKWDCKGYEGSDVKQRAVLYRLTIQVGPKTDYFAS